MYFNVLSCELTFSGLHMVLDYCSSSNCVSVHTRLWSCVYQPTCM